MSEEELLFYWYEMVAGDRGGGSPCYVFGKLAPDGKTSCCVRIENLTRTFYACPRQSDESSLQLATEELASVAARFGMTDAKAEVVARNNPFFDEVPRGQAKFVRIRTRNWSAKFPRACSGATFSKLLEQDTNCVERVALKLRLRGPSWLYATGWRSESQPHTWTQTEFVVPDERSLRTSSRRGKPHLTTLAIGFDGGEATLVHDDGSAERAADAAALGQAIRRSSPDVLIAHKLLAKVVPALPGALVRGRVLCDVSVAAREHLRGESADAAGTDASAALAIAKKLDLLNLAQMLAKHSGHTLNGCLVEGRAKRVEFALLHAFYDLNCILPEPTAAAPIERKRQRHPRYEGGCVFESVAGVHDWVAVLDFKSMYPSVIREHGVCFTTSGEGERDVGVLSFVVRRYVEARRAIKEKMATTADEVALAELNVEQLALKLLANSTYGCLGATFTRFRSRELAERIAALGRRHWQQMVDTTTALFPNVRLVAGDTDSVMTALFPGEDGTGHTREEAVALGTEIARAINAEQNSPVMEVELADVYERMVVFKKKRYAALGGRGGLRVERGLDAVRRDCCAMARDAANRVLDAVLEERDPAAAVERARRVLREVRETLASPVVATDEHVIAIELSRPLLAFPTNAAGHVAAARNAHRSWDVHDVVRYVVCEGDEPVVAEEATGKQIDRAFYAQKQVGPAVSRILAAVTPDAERIVAAELAAAAAAGTGRGARVAVKTDLLFAE